MTDRRKTTNDDVEAWANYVLNMHITHDQFNEIQALVVGLDHAEEDGDEDRIIPMVSRMNEIFTKLCGRKRNAVPHFGYVFDIADELFCSDSSDFRWVYDDRPRLRDEGVRSDYCAHVDTQVALFGERAAQCMLAADYAVPAPLSDVFKVFEDANLGTVTINTDKDGCYVYLAKLDRIRWQVKHYSGIYENNVAFDLAGWSEVTRGGHTYTSLKELRDELGRLAEEVKFNESQTKAPAYVSAAH